MEPFTRQRFREICQGDRPGDFGILGYHFNNFWLQTPATWVTQGAPGTFIESDWEERAVPEFFQFDRCRALNEINSGINSRVVLCDLRGTAFEDNAFLASPPFEPEVVEEGEQSITFTTGACITEKLLKSAPFNMPMWLDHPVKDRSTWENFKERLDPDTPERYPPKWGAFVSEINALDCPVLLGVGGFFGFINMWVGTERLMYMFHDDPGLIDDMMEAVLRLMTGIVKHVTRDIRIDAATYWEDMSYKTGSMISPEMVRKHMLPRYRKLNEVIRKGGCDFIYLDSDGNIEQLIPLWLETGINMFWPLECCSSAMDPVALRKKYGKEIILAGGLDKREFMRGKDAVRQEVMGKVPYLANTGGYFPSLDHSVPIDVPFENFRYFIKLLHEIRGDS